jgi:hypothetical protein
VSSALYTTPIPPPPSFSRIEFDLTLPGNKLDGAATTRPGLKSNVQLPHWVELQVTRITP